VFGGENKVKSKVVDKEERKRKQLREIMKA